MSYCILGLHRQNVPVGDDSIAYWSTNIADVATELAVIGSWAPDQPDTTVAGNLCTHVSREDPYEAVLSSCRQQLPFVCQKPACMNGKIICFITFTGIWQKIFTQSKNIMETFGFAQLKDYIYKFGIHIVRSKLGSLFYKETLP